MRGEGGGEAGNCERVRTTSAHVIACRQRLLLHTKECFGEERGVGCRLIREGCPVSWWFSVPSTSPHGASPPSAVEAQVGRNGEPTIVAGGRGRVGKHGETIEVCTPTVRCAPVRTTATKRKLVVGRAESLSTRRPRNASVHAHMFACPASAATEQHGDGFVRGAGAGTSAPTASSSPCPNPP